MTDKRCFLQWFVLCLGYAVITFFAAYYGVFQQVWTVDVTHLTSVIAMMFIAACGYLGAASWRYDNPWLKQDKRFAQRSPTRISGARRPIWLRCSGCSAPSSA